MQIPQWSAAVLCVGSLLVAGCAKGPQDRLQGKWVGESIDNIPPEREAQAVGWVKKTTFEFRGDKVTVSVPAEDARTGTFKIEKANGNRLTLQMTRSNGDADEANVVFTGENSFKWDIGNDRTVKFTKVVTQ